MHTLHKYPSCVCPACSCLTGVEQLLTYISFLDLSPLLAPLEVYTYIHTFIHPYIHTCIHAYIHTYIHMYIHTYIRTYMYNVKLLLILMHISYLLQVTNKGFTKLIAVCNLHHLLVRACQGITDTGVPLITSHFVCYSLFHP